MYNMHSLRFSLEFHRFLLYNMKKHWHTTVCANFQIVILYKEGIIYVVSR